VADVTFEDHAEGNVTVPGAPGALVSDRFRDVPLARETSWRAPVQAEPGGGARPAVGSRKTFLACRLLRKAVPGADSGP
jgi:hypothetical protein